LRIWKFQFAIDDEVKLSMPEGADILHIEAQGEMPCIWALVDEKRPREERCFRIIGTGQPVGDRPGIYVGTFQMSGGALVWHVFESRPLSWRDTDRV
jgi:hypothetical protein